MFSLFSSKASEAVGNTIYNNKFGFFSFACSRGNFFATDHASDMVGQILTQTDVEVIIVNSAAALLKIISDAMTESETAATDNLLLPDCKDSIVDLSTYTKAASAHKDYLSKIELIVLKDNSKQKTLDKAVKWFITAAKQFTEATKTSKSAFTFYKAYCAMQAAPNDDNVQAARDAIKDVILTKYLEFLESVFSTWTRVYGEAVEVSSRCSNMLMHYILFSCTSADRRFVSVPNNNRSEHSQQRLVHFVYVSG
eukprot:GHVQ01039420.1.p1 GENE.GHVQ01039420.1~~GHVQ01039420.1.p1  ORF type:complete len:253 (+),score=20.23 GHVQ01039420.1:316-1074(+)